MKPIPLHSADLIAELDKTISGVPTESDTDRQVWMKVGQRKLLDNLKLRLNEDNKGLPNVLS